jgi:hypothetical protein
MVKLTSHPPFTNHNLEDIGYVLFQVVLPAAGSGPYLDIEQKMINTQINCLCSGFLLAPWTVTLRISKITSKFF